MNTYRVQKTILANEERSLYHALTLVVAQRAILLSKVTLSAMLEPITPSAGRAPGNPRTHLERYIVDFALCDRNTTQPLFVILVDAQTAVHRSQQAGHNDVMQEICEAAGLPVLRITQESAYRMDKLQRLIEPFFAGEQGDSAYAQEDRVPFALEHKPPTIARPGTLFSRN